MELTPYNIQQITKCIQSEVDYNFFNAGYTYAFKDDQVLLEQNDKEIKQVCFHCLLVPKYPLVLNADTSRLLWLREYRKYKFMFKKIFPCPIC